MKEEFGWSYGRIAGLVKMSAAAVKAGVKAARNASEMETNADALMADPELQDVMDVPEYRNDPAVREWLLKVRGKSVQD
jgi:hypothetical protein